MPSLAHRAVHAFHRLGALGDLPTDSEEERLQHRFLVWMGLLMSLGGVAWGSLALLARLGSAWVVPFGYVALTLVNFGVYAATRRFDVARWVQVALSLLLPFLFQAVLGGFAASGGVMLWALLALVGSLTFSTLRQSLQWWAMFLVLTVGFGALDPWLRQRFDHGVGEDLRTWMAVLSICGIASIVFGLTTYVLSIRRRDNEALLAANEHASALVDALEEQVHRAEQAEREAREANVAKSLFLANMSHELRTPLNAILGYTELLVEEAPDLPHLELHRIRGAGAHLLELIDDVLDLSKIEAGRMELDQGVVDLPTVVRGVVTTLEPLARRNGNEVTVAFDHHLCPVISDEQKLRKILYNLVGNSAKFTRDGRIDVRVRCDGVGPVVEVVDNGIGMTPEQLSRVLLPFVQADPSTTRRYGGTGLGLHLVDQYAQMLGGQLRLRSEPGRGTTATVTLKAVPAPGYAEERVGRG